MQSDRGVVPNTTAHPQSAASGSYLTQCLSRHCPATRVAVLGDFLPPGRDEGSLAGEGTDPHCLGRSRELLLRGATAALLGLRGLRGRETLGQRAAGDAEGVLWPPSRGDPAKHGQPGLPGASGADGGNAHGDRVGGQSGFGDEREENLGDKLAVAHLGKGSAHGRDGPGPASGGVQPGLPLLIGHVGLCPRVSQEGAGAM